MERFASLISPEGVILWPLGRGGGMASRSRDYTRSEADPTGRFRPRLTAEQAARIAAFDASEKRMANLKYTHSQRPMPISMSKGMDKAPLFWLTYAALAAVAFGVLWVTSGG